MQLLSSSHLWRWIYSCQAIISGTLIEVVQVFSSSHILSLMHFKPSSPTPSQRWSILFQGILSVNGYMVFQPSSLAFLQWCHSVDGYMVFKQPSLAPLQRWCSCFQACVSGDGYMVFKPSSLTPFQRWCSCFLSIISWDSCFSRVSSLEVFIWLSCNYLLHIYRDYAAVFRVSSMKMGISMVFKPSSLAPLWQNLWLN